MSIRSYLLDAFFSALKKEISLQPAGTAVSQNISIRLIVA